MSDSCDIIISGSAPLQKATTISRTKRAQSCIILYQVKKKNQNKPIHILLMHAALIQNVFPLTDQTLQPDCPGAPVFGLTAEKLHLRKNKSSFTAPIIVQYVRLLVRRKKNPESLNTSWAHMQLPHILIPLCF